MGDGIKVGLNGVVIVLLLQDKAKASAVFNTNNFGFQEGWEI